MTQSDAWSRAAEHYATRFINPYREDVKNPLPEALRRIPRTRGKVVADLGCGMGPLLPSLARRFQQVHAVDFAPGMLERARAACTRLTNVQFHARPLTDLTPLHGTLDVAIAANSLVMPDVRDADRALEQIRICLKPGGWLLGIVPAMDSVHYLTMLLLDRALASGKPMDSARKNAAHLADHADYDFAFSQCALDGLQQHFWHPFELRYRLEKAAYKHVRLAKVELSWEEFTWSEDVMQQPPPWDWYFSCRTSLAAPRS